MSRNRPGLCGGEISMIEPFLTSRRSVLAGITAMAGSLTFGRSALGMLDAPSSKPDDFVAGKPDQLAPFPMTQVRLLDGIFKAQAEINQAYLDSLATDRLLHSFRLTTDTREPS